MDQDQNPRLTIAKKDVDKHKPIHISNFYTQSKALRTVLETLEIQDFNEHNLSQKF